MLRVRQITSLDLFSPPKKKKTVQAGSPPWTRSGRRRVQTWADYGETGIARRPSRGCRAGEDPRRECWHPNTHQISQTPTTRRRFAAHKWPLATLWMGNVSTQSGADGSSAAQADGTRKAGIMKSGGLTYPSHDRNMWRVIRSELAVPPAVSPRTGVLSPALPVRRGHSAVLTEYLSNPFASVAPCDRTL